MVFRKYNEWFLMLAMIFTSIFYFYPVSAATSAVIISEIGAYEPEGYEWIEIYNRGTVLVDLTNWKFYEQETNHKLTVQKGVNALLSPGTYAVIAEDVEQLLQKYPTISVHLFDSSWGTLNESGETIGLKDENEVLQESFIYVPTTQFSLERVNLLVDDYSVENWKEHISGNTIGNAYSSITPVPVPPVSVPATPSPPTSLPSPPSVVVYPTGVIIINEFVSDPTDAEEEWIELFNKSDVSIDVSGWNIQEGSETKTILSGTLLPKGFLVIEKPKGNLNNSGDRIILFDQSGNKMDQVTYGNWQDGFLEDNAEAPKDPESAARKFDGTDSNNDQGDFTITNTPTKGKPNILTTDEEPPITSSNSFQDQIRITEIFPNPKGADTEDEFIEIKNTGTIPIDLAGWQIGNRKKQYTIPKGVLPPNEFLFFKRSKTGIVLHNTEGDIVRLITPTGQSIAQQSYSGPAPEDQSYARDENGKWFWTHSKTAGRTNIIDIPHTPPTAVIDGPKDGVVDIEYVFDGSDSSDAEDSLLTYHWNFADGKKEEGVETRHTFKKPRTHQIILTVKDPGGLTDTTTSTVRVTLGGTGGPVGDPDTANILITEFLPNPEGGDADEWIELFNAGDDAIDLYVWKLDDAPGGSAPYVFPFETTLAPKEHRTFTRKETGIILNNTEDSVRLIDPDGTIHRQVEYDQTQEGIAITVQTKNQTASQKTIRSTPAKKVSTKVKPKSDSFTSIPLAKVRELDLGDRVQVTGTVSVAPGILGSQIFYLAGSGIQVYSYKKDFPELQIGDQVEVSGILSEAYGEMRMKIAKKEDIKKIGKGPEPKAQLIQTEEIDEPLEGHLVQVVGDIVETKNNQLYLDDGQGEVLVYLKESSNISSSIATLGDQMAITGIISQTKNGYRLLPRGAYDFEKRTSTATVNANSSTSKTDTQKEVAEKYLTATAGGLTSLLVALVLRASKGTFTRIVVIGGIIEWWRKRRKKDV